MGFKSSSLLCLALFLAVSSSIHALDITKLLGQYPEFATFNKYLTETKLADQINTRNTITVLVVDDAGLSAISGKSQQAIKATLSTQVILDYFDEKKLVEAQGSGQPLPTLYQASGLAVNQQGFIKVALVGEGEIAFGSAVSGAPMAAELVKTVTTVPYNISILQISKPIVVPGIDSQTPSSPSSNAQSPTGAAKAPVVSAKTPEPAQNAKAPVSQGAKAPVSQGAKAPAQAAQAPTQSAKAPASAQSAKAPAPAKGAQAPSPTEEATAPSPSDVSVTDSPAEAPATILAQAPAPGPVGAEGQAADASPPSSSSRTQIGFVGAVMAFASLLVAL